MELQVLVSAMNQKNRDLVKKMNLQTNAIIINQCDRVNYEQFYFKNKEIKIFSFDEKGVGLSRNSALMRAEADICLFADEDLTYVEGYKDIVMSAFKQNPKADIILFNVTSNNPARPTFKIKRKKRLRVYNVLKYGAVRIAFRTSSLRKANVHFSLLYGGGAIHSAGEDSLFLVESIRKGLKVYSNPSILGVVAQEESTWFDGYNKKYFYDKGIWIANAFPHLKNLLSIYYTIKLHKISKSSLNTIYKEIKSGIKDFKL